MNIVDFDTELLYAGTHEQVCFRHALDGSIHIINEIECKGNIVYLKESIRCDYKEHNCQQLAVEIEALELSGLINWDENTEICFMYTGDKHATDVISYKFLTPFTHEDDCVFVEFY